MVLAVASFVAVAAFPEVSWLPEVFTPGKFMFPVPSNDTPPIFRAVSRAVAVAALPVQDPDYPEALPVTFPVNAPANPVAVRTPDEELKVRLVPDFGARLPVAAVANRTLHEVSDDSSATVTVVAIAAVPDVS